MQAMRLARTLVFVHLTLAHAWSAPDATGLKQTAILIRHGEKPKDGDDLSPRGEQRAKCLADHFAHRGLTGLFAYTDHPSKRSVETLMPLSNSLSLPIDTDFGRDDVDGLVKHLSSLPEEAVVLICWEHKVLTTIAKALGVKNAPEYPSSEYDWQWTVVNGTLTQANENC